MRAACIPQKQATPGRPRAALYVPAQATTVTVGRDKPTHDASTTALGMDADAGLARAQALDAELARLRAEEASARERAAALQAELSQLQAALKPPPPPPPSPPPPPPPQATSRAARAAPRAVPALTLPPRAPAATRAPPVLVPFFLYFLEIRRCLEPVQDAAMPLVLILY